MRRRFGVREADYVVRTVNAEPLQLACKLGSDAAGSGGVREEDRAECDAGRARGGELERIAAGRDPAHPDDREPGRRDGRSEEHTSELQSRLVISYAVF